MAKRFMTIWFRHLATDWLAIKQPELKGTPYVFAVPDHGRMIITAANPVVEAQGIRSGVPVADAKAIIPSLQVFDENPVLNERLLKALGKWCIRYTPIVAVDIPDGLTLDISGCAHLWGGERVYLKEIVTRLRTIGYDNCAAIADTVGTAWAIARFGKITPIIETGQQERVLLPLPPAALRLDIAILIKLEKLGLYQISSFAGMPASILRRRFGTDMLEKLARAKGQLPEHIKPIQVIPPYHERLPCLEPIRTAPGIEIAIQKLLEALCVRLYQEGKGIRTAVLKGYRIDGKIEQVEIGTNKASCNVPHLFKMLSQKVCCIEPDLGIELFTLDASKIEDIDPAQEKLWAKSPGLLDESVIQLLDRLAGKVGANAIHRYLPKEHHWPERSIKLASSLDETSETEWRTDKPRPVKLLAQPEPIFVTAPMPDYPPMLFRYKGELHKIVNADWPERIEQEWWLEEGQHRDYYPVEDEKGRRYWLFRSGHYDDNPQWFIHGFFA
jgi:protein ImuB